MGAAEWITAWQRGWAAETELNWAVAAQRSGMLLGRMSLKGVKFHDGSAGLSYWMVTAARDEACARRRRRCCVGGHSTQAFTASG